MSGETGEKLILQLKFGCCSFLFRVRSECLWLQHCKDAGLVKMHLSSQWLTLHTASYMQKKIQTADQTLQNVKIHRSQINMFCVLFLRSWCLVKQRILQDCDDMSKSFDQRKHSAQCLYEQRNQLKSWSRWSGKHVKHATWWRPEGSEENMMLTSNRATSWSCHCCWLTVNSNL